MLSLGKLEMMKPTVSRDYKAGTCLTISTNLSLIAGNLIALINDSNMEYHVVE